MEHSILHALQLTGLIAALGGPLFVLLLVLPASRENGGLTREILHSAASWSMRAALAAAGAAFTDLFVQVAELQGKSLFAGFDLETTWRYATQTIAGRLALARIACLCMTAVLVGRTLRDESSGRLRVRWFAGALFSAAAVICASFVSHAAASPTGRVPALLSQVLHIAAAALWLGVLFHLFVARGVFSKSDGKPAAGLIGEIVRRFSPVALTAASLLGLSGLYGVYRFLGSAQAVGSSAYGLTLVVKLMLVVVVLYAGFVNYRRIRPALLTPEASSQTLRENILRFGRMVELEVTAGILVIAVAGILGSVSPPGPEGAARVTTAQMSALLSPDLPTTAIANPSSFYGAPTRTLDDLRYAEFTHNWSGVFVILLGLAWFGQAAGGNAGRAFGISWPFLLLPFAGFIGVAADPEIWILRQVSVADAFKDPQLVEHQLGAMMVLLLLWRGWRDRRIAPEKRPLGYALPLLMIAGSLMLLGHAHSNLTAAEDLTNLINVQHAVFGAFGLTAGTVRWFQLRELVSGRMARFAWPSLVILLGIFMAFFYREIV